MKFNNKYLIKIIEKPSEYSSKYNEFERLFKKNKNASALSEYQF